MTTLNSTTAPRVLIAVTSHGTLGTTGKDTGYYLSEVSHPWKALTDAGYAVDFVSPEGGSAPMDPTSHDLDDDVNATFVETEDFKRLDNTLRPEDVNASEYVGIWFAGGHGTMWDFPVANNLINLTELVYTNGGAIGAVCHGPAALVNVKEQDGSYLVDGKRLAAFTDEEERAAELDDVVPFLLASRLEERGATHEAAPNFEKNVVVDGRLVTGQNPASALEAGRAFAKVLDDITEPQMA